MSDPKLLYNKELRKFVFDYDEGQVDVSTDFYQAMLDAAKDQGGNIYFRKGESTAKRYICSVKTREEINNQSYCTDEPAIRLFGGSDESSYDDKDFRMFKD